MTSVNANVFMLLYRVLSVKDESVNVLLHSASSVSVQSLIHFISRNVIPHKYPSLFESFWMYRIYVKNLIY